MQQINTNILHYLLRKPSLTFISVLNILERWNWRIKWTKELKCFSVQPQEGRSDGGHMTHLWTGHSCKTLLSGHFLFSLLHILSLWPWWIIHDSSSETQIYSRIALEKPCECLWVTNQLHFYWLWFPCLYTFTN